MGEELKHRVEGQELDARSVEDLFARNDRKHLIHYVLSSFVAITDRQFNQITLAVEQRVIDAPTVDADTRNPSTKVARSCRGVPQSFLYLIKDLWEIPTKMSR